MVDHGEGYFTASITQAPQEIRNNCYPRVTFGLNQDLDVKVGTRALGCDKTAGMDASADILNAHPDLHNLHNALATIKEPEIERAMNQYVTGYYDSNQDKLKSAILEFQKVWKDAEPKYFKFVDTIFNGYKWPAGSYMGFLSIFSVGPRFLDTKTFSLDYTKIPEAVGRISHEMLHLIFYDWLENKETIFAQSIGDDQVHALSEIFNDMAMKLPEYKKVSPRDFPLSYPDLQPLEDEFNKSLEGKDFSIEWFVAEAKKIYSSYVPNPSALPDY